MKKTIKYKHCNTLRGFTLVEMAVVLVIMALLMAAFLTPLSAQRDLRDYSETKIRLEHIRDALYGYAIINGQLPCPTTTADPTDNINYGHGDAVCPLTTGAGYVPWKDLGVHEVDAWGTPRNLAADPWLGYWIYRVDPAFTTTFSLATTTTGNIDIKKSDGTSQTIASERAAAVICTAGKNLVADGENATYETANPVYQNDVQSLTFDDMCIWITRPSLFNRMVSASKLP